MLACWVGVSGIKHHGGLGVSCCSLLQVLWARGGTKAEVGSWGEMSPAGLRLCLSPCPACLRCGRSAGNLAGLGRGCTSRPRCGRRLSAGRRARTWRNLRAPSEGFGSGLGACRGEETIRAFVGRLTQRNVRLCSWVPWLLWEARLKLRQENLSRACLSEVFENINACGALGLHFSMVLERQGKSLPLFGPTSAALLMQKSKQ